MKIAVQQAFVAFTDHFEGTVDCMYRDIKNLVTTGIGNLIDPIELARGLPWVVGGSEYLATQAEIDSEWHMIKDAPHLDTLGWRAAKKIARLRLTPTGIRELVLSKLSQNEAYLRVRFPDLDTWPSDAQLGLFSWCWAVGPAAYFPMFAAACRAKDWAEAAKHVHIRDEDDPRTPQNEANPGLHPRNVANAILFSNAARVVAHGLDPELLYYPRKLDEEMTPTKPEILSYSHSPMAYEEDENGTDRIARLEDLVSLAHPDLDEDTDPTGEE